jgi:UDP-3-O-[3-hydroxymyristoyl] glucosamine N-acyltransferase
VKLLEIARIVKGEIAGDPGMEITGVSGAPDAGEGEITFLSNRKHMEDVLGSRASCILVGEFLKDTGKAQIKVENPYYAFAVLLEHFHARAEVPAGISRLAFVSDKARIGEDVSVYPFAYVSDGASIGKKSVLYPGVFVGEGSSVGDGCVLYPNVIIREGVKVGSRVIIHAGAVIGSDGFGYVQHKGRHHKVPQVGGVIIGDDVEIGACTTVDRATTGQTIIGGGAKIDNLVQIAHNVRVGEGSIIVAQAGIAGSSTIGRGVMLGGQVGVSDHAVIEDGVMVAAKSGVMGRLEKGVYGGTFAIPHRQWLKAEAVFRRLPELQRKIKELEDKISELERRQRQ